ncbi:hypothetical protein [Serratia quinivorans]|uniref:hypothetical protein n=1 Tax=Serratia TaxID=613 RepID=UPI002178E01B|nr:hypothetical protein [Serratia quinivorans]CAI0913753.1 Uncharacterised protein [Serratia quinivorans]CAI2096681.1 Uncharacterised protein [Serratia quinivorans]
MIVKVIYKNGEEINEDMSVNDAAIRLKTDVDVQAIEFPDDASNRLLEKRLEELLVLGLK